MSELHRTEYLCTLNFFSGNRHDSVYRGLTVYNYRARGQTWDHVYIIHVSDIGLENLSQEYVLGDRARLSRLKKLICD